MATCSITKSRSCAASLKYGLSKEGHKRDTSKVYADGHNCDAADPDATAAQMTAERSVSRPGGRGRQRSIESYNMLQSFSANDTARLTLEQANRLGLESLAEFMHQKGFSSDDYTAACYTHNDSDGGMLHNHIVLNNVNHSNMKAIDMWRSGLDWQRACNAVSRAHHLDCLADEQDHQNATVAASTAERAILKRTDRTYRDDIRTALDQELAVCVTTDELRDRLLDKYNITMYARGRELSFKDAQGRRARGSRLGGKYSANKIMNQLHQNTQNKTREGILLINLNDEESLKAYNITNKDIVSSLKKQLKSAKSAKEAMKQIDQNSKDNRKNKQDMKNEPDSYYVAKDINDAVNKTLQVCHITAKVIKQIGNVAGMIPVIGKPLKIISSLPDSAINKVRNVKDKIDNKVEEAYQFNSKKKKDKDDNNKESDDKKQQISQQRNSQAQKPDSQEKTNVATADQAAVRDIMSLMKESELAKEWSMMNVFEQDKARQRAFEKEYN